MKNTTPKPFNVQGSLDAWVDPANRLTPDEARATTESKAKVILRRAHRAAAGRGLYCDPRRPAEAVAAVLREALRTGR